MYTKLTYMKTPYGDITCVYGKIHVTVMYMIIGLEITKLFYIEYYVLILLHEGI